MSVTTETGPRRREAYAVWELTLKCNLACGHCGSRAGEKRDNELSTEEALDLVRQFAEVGITEVTIEGGEAFLRPDWLTIARAITDHGMICSMVTGGYGLSRETARRMKAAGISSVTVSVDGLEATHNQIRGRERSFQSCFETFGHLRGRSGSSFTRTRRSTGCRRPSCRHCTNSCATQGSGAGRSSSRRRWATRQIARGCSSSPRSSTISTR